MLRPEAELAVFRSIPAWQARVAAAPTITRELRAAAVTAPTLMLLGGDSPTLVQEETAMVADALPDVRVTVLEGQQHIAIDLVPELFARHVLDFVT